MSIRKPVAPSVADSRRIRVGASWKLAATADRGRIRVGASWKQPVRG